MNVGSGISYYPEDETVLKYTTILYSICLKI